MNNAPQRDHNIPLKTSKDQRTRICPDSTSFTVHRAATDNQGCLAGDVAGGDGSGQGDVRSGVAGLAWPHGGAGGEAGAGGMRSGPADFPWAWGEGRRPSAPLPFPYQGCFRTSLGPNFFRH